MSAITNDSSSYVDPKTYYAQDDAKIENEAVNEQGSVEGNAEQEQKQQEKDIEQYDLWV